MEPAVEFGLLGPLVVRCDGVDVPLPKGKQRALLSMLLVNAGHVVPVVVLAEALWGSEPPPSAEASIRNYVKRLRKALGDAGRERICTRAPGYLIRVADDELDVSRFEALLQTARAAARQGAWQDAACHARAALALWRGEPLTDAPSDALALREVPRLAELRVQAVQTRLDADLHLGRHAEMIAELEQLIAAHPLREHLYSLLMLALCRCGRQAEALAEYQRARRVLIDELGVEPGPGLRELHQRILAADPATAAAEPARPLASGGLAPAIPREVPARVRHFTGRASELKALNQLLDQTDGEKATTVLITAIGGTAGVGKTALAVHWAHQAAGRFPDGQLYVNLRGYDPDQPMSAADALAGFLQSLGVPGQDVPPEAEQRAARYRSLLAGKRMLVMLDNAGSADQVRPLLPGTPDCAVVVTSRESLTGLVARDGAARLDLDVLRPEEAVALLRALIGARVDADPRAATELARQCCRLPLALRVAAELAATRPAVPLAGLTKELAHLRTRLDLLDADGDPRTDVRAVFSWSYRHLGAEAARTFRLLGLHPGPDVELYAVAALADATVTRSRRALDVLARAHLIQPAGPGRYGMHDLLRAYARELADARDGDETQNAALTRLFDRYLHSASMMMDTVYPAERHRRPGVLPPATPAPQVADAAAARAWLDAELANLVAVAVHAAGHGWPVHAIRLSETIFRYLDHSGHYAEAFTIHNCARAAADGTDDRAAEANALSHLGNMHRRQSRYQQAADHMRKALALFRQANDVTAQGRLLGNLGNIHYHLGRYQEAAGLHQQALAIFGETGDLFGQANTLDNLAISEELQGRYDLAARHYRQAMTIAADIGARELECVAVNGLGSVSLRQGRYQQAAVQLDRALAMCREIGYREIEVNALARIGELSLRLGHPDDAVRHLREALSLSRELGSQYGEADALNSLGDVLLATGQPDHARAEYATALRLTAQIGYKYEQARAHRGLGMACHADGDPGGARSHWQQALALFTELGVPEAAEIQNLLAPRPSSVR